MNNANDILDELDVIKKDDINPLLHKIYLQSLTERLITFKPPFKGITEILELIGTKVLETIIRYREPKYDENKFNFYFWPGYTTLDGKRVFIEGENTNRVGQEKYFVGIGRQYDESKNIDEIFYDCPSTIAFDEVLNSKYFSDGYNKKYPETKFYPGSTHFFRLNQVNPDKSTYLPLRLPNPKNNGRKGDLKILKISIENLTNEQHQNVYKISLDIEKIHESGWVIREKLKEFIDSQEEEKGYIYWPFNVIAFKKRIDNTEIKEIEEKIIGIQTQLYSYWIGQTLNDGNIFNYEDFKNKLYTIINEAGYEDLIPELEFNPIKSGINITQVYFKYWYTIFHESFTPNEDLGSTMILSNVPIRKDYLIAIDSWIKEIYNELKLIETKTRAEFETQRSDFGRLEHIQEQYLSYLYLKIGDSAISNILPIIELLRTGLKVARYFNNPELLIQKIDLDDSKEKFNIYDCINDCKKIVTDLCKDIDTLREIFLIKNEEDRTEFVDLASQDLLINVIIQSAKSYFITTYYDLFKIYIVETLINCIKHVTSKEKKIEIIIKDDKITFLNAYEYSQSYLNKRINDTNRLGLKILKTIELALSLNIESLLVDEIKKIVCTTLKLENHET
ncbi:MAG: hypothetical protein ACFFG0_05120 [Candidatus Thorarchaeota archaeon]